MRKTATALLILLFAMMSLPVQAQTTPDGALEHLMGFGRAVAVNDGSVLVGEPANPHQPGMVYIYGQENGQWARQARLSASDGSVGDGFGAALAASGSYVLVGAPGQSDGSGAAYVFEQADGSWNQAARLAASGSGNGNSGYALGASVALHGDWAFVGAPRAGDGNGVVYVYQRSGSGSWSQAGHIANPDTATGTNFGVALATDGTQLLVGAPRGQGGVAYVYRQDGNGRWTQQQTLRSDRLDDGARFGSTIAFNGNRALIGAPRQDSGAGAAFVFNQDAEGWESAGSLVAYDSAPRYGFGSSVALHQSTAFIGAPRAADGSGALYQFEQGADGDWMSVHKVNGPADRGESAQFAGTFAVSSQVAVAGLVGSDYGAGSIAILERGGDGSWKVQQTFVGEGSSSLEAITGSRTECEEGSASLFGCGNVDLLSFMPTEKIGGSPGVRLNDIWGWTDPKTGKEYALVGRMDGTSFVDVSDPMNPVYVGSLPKTEGSNTSVWRDIKVYKNHAYVVADNAGQHGMQVVDLTDLRDYEGTPLTLDEAALYSEIHSAHNVVINEDTGYAFAVGSSGGGQTCGGGLHMINIQDPENPTFAGCFADPSTGRSGTGYTHDAQCVTYQGPDKEHQGDEICFGANETAISIANVSDKSNPQALATMSYPDYAYVHQGWLTEDHKYFLQNDELDELTGNVDSTRTLVWDVSDLDNPQFVREYFFDNASSDHNLYIQGNTMYQSNYVSGLQVLDVSDPENPQKIGFFDTEPFGEDTPGFAGTWSNYPFFESGIVIMTSSQEGLFVLDPEN